MEFQQAHTFVALLAWLRRDKCSPHVVLLSGRCRNIRRLSSKLFSMAYFIVRLTITQEAKWFSTKNMFLSNVDVDTYATFYPYDWIFPIVATLLNEQIIHLRNYCFTLLQSQMWTDIARRFQWW